MVTAELVLPMYGWLGRVTGTVAQHPGTHTSQSVVVVEAGRSVGASKGQASAVNQMPPTYYH